MKIRHMHAFESDVRLILPTGCAVDLTRFTHSERSNNEDGHILLMSPHALMQLTFPFDRMAINDDNYLKIRFLSNTLGENLTIGIFTPEFFLIRISGFQDSRIPGFLSQQI